MLGTGGVGGGPSGVGEAGGVGVTVEAGPGTVEGAAVGAADRGPAGVGAPAAGVEAGAVDHASAGVEEADGRTGAVDQGSAGVGESGGVVTCARAPIASANTNARLPNVA